jgi:hypothetical protein
MALLSSTFVNPWRLVPPGILLALAFVAVTAGVLLFRRALRGSRVGDVPHCPACDYVLTGLPTDAAGARCPECGEALDARPVPRGERKRQPLFAAVGLPPLLLAVPMVVVASLEIHWQLNWYGLRRLTTVLADVESPAPAVSDRAWYELFRRRADGVVLTPAQHQRLVEVALARLQLPGRGTLQIEYWLTEVMLDGKLSPAQREKFFANRAVAALRVRPTAVRGDPVPMEVTYRYAGPGTPWVDLIDPTCDGVPLPGLLAGPVDEVGSVAGATPGVLTRRVMIDPPGRHTIRVTARVSVFRERYTPLEPTEMPLHQLDLPLTAEVEVLAAAPPDYIRLIKDDALAQRLNAAITADSFWLLTLFNPVADVSGELDVKKVPVNIAFDAFARVDGKLYPMGSIALAKGGSKSFIVRTDAPAVTAATEIDVVLRTSERAARQTVDLLEVWDGELVFPGVTVRRLPRFLP